MPGEGSSGKSSGGASGGVRVRKAPPTFYSVPHNKVAEPGETVRFQCNVGGNPSPKVSWDRNNVAVRPEADARVRLEERDDVRVLEIRNVTLEVIFPTPEPRIPQNVRKFLLFEMA